MNGNSVLTCDLETAYLGAFDKPDSSCLDYLTETVGPPSERFYMVEQVRTVALTAAKGHVKYLRCLHEKLRYTLTVDLFVDMLCSTDKRCLEYFLDCCGKGLVASFAQDPQFLMGTMGRFRGNCEFMRYVLQYLLSNVYGSNMTECYQVLSDLCSELFVRTCSLNYTPYNSGHIQDCHSKAWLTSPIMQVYPRKDVFDKLRFLMGTFYAIRDVLTRREHGRLPLAAKYTDIIDTDIFLNHILCTSTDGTDILRFLVEDLRLDLSMLVISVECCFKNGALYAYTQHKPSAPSVMTSHQHMGSLLSGRMPSEVLNALHLVENGIIPFEYLAEYCDRSRCDNTLMLREVLALKVLTRASTRASEPVQK